jgi:hypothetical protein
MFAGVILSGYFLFGISGRFIVARWREPLLLRESIFVVL